MGYGRLLKSGVVFDKIYSETMKASFSAPRKINSGYSVNRCCISPTVLKNFLDKNGKIKHLPLK